MRARSTVVLALVAVAAVLGACGGKPIAPTTTGAAGAGSAGTSGGAGMMGGAGMAGGAGTSGGAGAGPCPPQVPPANELCGLPRKCTYYEPGFHPPCATVATCNRVWLIARPDPACGQRPPQCPPSYASVPVGDPCLVDPQCDYDEGRCLCTKCVQQGDIIATQWSCRRWDTGGDGCPALAPLEGTACTADGQFCIYGNFCRIAVGNDLMCAGNTWQPLPSPPGLCGRPVCGQR